MGKKRYKKHKKQKQKQKQSKIPLTPSVGSGISVCMIVKNEEKNLPNCLSSIQNFANEIVVVDTGSTDGTKEVIKRYGAKLVETEWENDFSKARNLSLEHATQPWIMWLDADDVVPKNMVPKLIQLKSFPLTQSFAFQIYNNQEIKPGGSSFLQIRMFPNRPDVRFTRRIHEQVADTLKALGIKNQNVEVAIINTGYEDADQKSKKAKRNLEIQKAEIKQNPHDPTLVMSLGDSYMILGEYVSAIAVYHQVFKMGNLKEAQADVFHHIPAVIGNAYIKKKEFDEAVKYISMALEREPKNLIAACLMGEAKYYLGEMKAAEAFFKQTLNMDYVPRTYAVAVEKLRKRAADFLVQINNIRQKTLSVCMIVKNEEENLPACLTDIRKFADEIIVVDTGSQDRTMEIARQYGAKVFETKWENDFSMARNFSLTKATKDWIVWWDADDRVSPINIGKIKMLKTYSAKQAYGFGVKCTTDGLGGKIFLQVRMFPNFKGVKFEGRIHEQIGKSLDARDLKVQNTDIVINHIGYDTLAHVEVKQRRNITILKEEVEQDKDCARLWFSLGNAYLDLQKFQEAIPCYQTAHRLLQTTIQDTSYLGKYVPVFVADCYYLLGQREKTWEWVKIAEKLDKDNIQATLLMGLLYYDERQFAQANQKFIETLTFEENVEAFPLDKRQMKVKALYRLGEYLQQLGKQQLTMALYKEVLNFHKSADYNIIKFGDLFFNAEEFGLAKIVYLNCWQKREVAAGVGLGKIAIIENKVEEAIRFLKAVYEIAPQNVEGQFLLAELYFDVRCFDQALPLYEGLKKTSSNDPQILARIKDCAHSKITAEIGDY